MVRRKVEARSKAMTELGMVEDLATISTYRGIAKKLRRYYPDGFEATLTNNRRRKTNEEVFVEDLYDLIEPLKEALKRNRTSRQSPLFQALHGMLGHHLPAALRTRAEFLDGCRRERWQPFSFKEETLQAFERLLDEAENAVAAKETTAERQAGNCPRGIEPSPSISRAYTLYLKALDQKPELKGGTDGDVYNHVKENLLDRGEGLPSEATFKRYLRKARAVRKQQKNSPRAGREGVSIRRSEEI